MKYLVDETLYRKMMEVDMMITNIASLQSEIMNELSKQEEAEYDKEAGLDRKGDY